jgi:hypothetical protein
MNGTSIPKSVYLNTLSDRRTNEKMERPTPMKTEEAWNGLCSVAADADDYKGNILMIHQCRNCQYCYNKTFEWT